MARHGSLSSDTEVALATDLVGLGGAGPATALTLGTVKLSAAPSNPLSPVAAESGDVTTKLAGKAASTHTHAQSDVTNLVSDLAAKAASTHTHAQADVTGLTTALSGKAASVHTHATADVTGLDTALTGKAAAVHTHAESDITNLVSDLAAKAPATLVPNASYRTILDSSGSHTAARVAGTYGFAQGDPVAISGTGTLYPLNTIYIAAADFPTLNGVAAKLRVRAVLHVNDVAPTGNFTFGLHPITRPATSGGAGLLIYTIGAAVTGSTVTSTAPAADLSAPFAGTDFALPADGHYVLGVVTTATVAVSSHLHMSAALQMRNA